MSSSVPCKRVFAIVVTYNGERWVRKCLGSLIASEHPVEIVVVDNESSDRTVAIIEDEFPDIRLVKNEKNLGFGRANNVGLVVALRAGADFVFLLNQDAWVESQTIRLLVEMQQMTGFALLSPVHYTGSGARLDPGFKSYLSKEYSVAGITKWLSADQPVVKATSFVNAAAWLLDSGSIAAIGGFSPLFSHYGEDRDYCQRLRYFGHKAGVVNHAKIFHDREDRFRKPPVKSYDQTVNLYFSSLVARACNINVAFLRALTESVAWCFRATILPFMRGRRPILVIVFIHALARLVLSLRRLMAYRQLARSGRKFLFMDNVN